MCRPTRNARPETGRRAIVITGLTVLLLSGTFANSLPAQSTAAVDLILAALPGVRETLPSGPAALDPQLLCTPRLAGWSCPERVDVAASALGLTLHSRHFTYICPGDARSCRLVAARSLVHFTEPVVTGDSASLLVDVWWASDDRSRPVAHRRSRLALRRQAGGWAVTRSEPLVAVLAQ